MKSIQIKDSYKIWRPYAMKLHIKLGCRCKYGRWLANEVLHRSYADMYCEWWLHNIGYYLTKPLCKIAFFAFINRRCKDVDLEES